MPELPEVESVRKSLLKVIPLGQKIKTFSTSPHALRFPYPDGISTQIENQQIYDIHRRAKYLLFDLGEKYFLCHLGMTGKWRKDRVTRKHDHVFIEFQSGEQFVYNDARRFGFVDLIAKDSWQQNKWFSHLGPEPLEKTFDAECLFQTSRKKQVPIKNFLMDQKVVVGVGNIYASEVLFLAGIRPTKKAMRITKKQARDIVEKTKQVLKQAIQKGGSYIRDFQSLEGAAEFQMFHYVYNKENCKVCGSKIKRIMLAGRSSFYCPKCQS